MLVYLWFTVFSQHRAVEYQILIASLGISALSFIVSLSIEYSWWHLRFLKYQVDPTSACSSHNTVVEYRIHIASPSVEYRSHLCLLSIDRVSVCWVSIAPPMLGVALVSIAGARYLSIEDWSRLQFLEYGSRLRGAQCFHSQDCWVSKVDCTCQNNQSCLEFVEYAVMIDNS